MLIGSALGFFLFLVTYMPDGWLADNPGGGGWHYGPARRLFAACGIAMSVVLALAALIDTVHAIVRRRSESRNDHAQGTEAPETPAD